MIYVVLIWLVVLAYTGLLVVSDAYSTAISLDVNSWLLRFLLMPTTVFLIVAGQVVNLFERIENDEWNSATREGFLVYFLMFALPIVFAQWVDNLFDYRFYPLFLGTAYILIRVLHFIAAVRAKRWEPVASETSSQT